MGRPKSPDRAWHRWDSSEKCWEIVIVEHGERSRRRCEVGTTEEEARAAAEELDGELRAGTLTAPDTWGDADVEDSAVGMFLKAAATGDHRPTPKRGKKRGVRKATIDWYKFRLREAGIVLRRIKGKDFDPLKITTADGVKFIAERSKDVAPSGEPVRGTTINGEIEAVTILQRWLVLRKWAKHASWDDLARVDAVNSREPVRGNDVGKFMRAAEKLTRDPRGTTDWQAMLDAKAKGEKVAKKSERRDYDWDKWLGGCWILMHGLRTEETHHVLVRDIDIEARGVWVRDRDNARVKTATAIRFVPIMSAEALTELARIVRDRPGGERVFDTGRGRGEVAKGRTQWFLRRCHETCRIAGIRRSSVHELRHTVATFAIAAGADLKSVQALLGHASEKTTRTTYGHVEAGALAMAAARIVGHSLDTMFRDAA